MTTTQVIVFLTLSSSGPTHEQLQEKITTKVDQRQYFDPVLMTKVIVDESDKQGVDPVLVFSVISVESAFRPNSISNVGAVGMMQLMPKTFKEVMDDPTANIWNPYLNVTAGIRYLGQLQREFSDVDMVLMAYNAGPHRIHGYRFKRYVPNRFRDYPRSVKMKRSMLVRDLEKY